MGVHPGVSFDALFLLCQNISKITLEAPNWVYMVDLYCNLTS